MKKIYIFILILIAILILVGLIYIIFQPTPPAIPQGETKTIAQNLEVPWAMDFLPNGTMIFTERVGRVNLLENNGTVIKVADINVSQVTESGLLGVAVDPNFSQNKFIYLYYTHDNGINRISRFILNGSLNNETVLLDNIPGGSIHNGGRLKFGPDGKLYATTGEGGDTSLSQNINSTGGKILRLNPDGSVPSDNPFGNYVYSYGHRDPQGIAWNPSNGILYASEHGATMNDEINIITKGGNYGWPIVQGDQNTSGYISPIRVYTNFTLAPSGIAFYQNRLYVTGLRGTQLRVLNFSDDGKTITSEGVFIDNIGRIRDVVVYDGYLYICTSNRDGRGLPQSGDDKIIRIKL
ncbi:MAG: PQQ-dependent sugar dehydrogenase [Methanobacterium sp.]|nr:PQQ-dependent sugar dehydrogenase [Methanobacterium sp.]